MALKPLVAKIVLSILCTLDKASLFVYMSRRKSEEESVKMLTSEMKCWMMFDNGNDE